MSILTIDLNIVRAVQRNWREMKKEREKEVKYMPEYMRLPFTYCNPERKCKNKQQQENQHLQHKTTTAFIFFHI